jgi:O-antigen/teichoic acid export membrane protein
MGLSVLGLSVILSFVGIPTYAIPALAQEYLNGQENVIQTVEALFSGKLFAIIILGSLLQFVGFVLFGVAIWRSETLPKWAGGLLVIAGLFLAVPADIRSRLSWVACCWF